MKPSEIQQRKAVIGSNPLMLVPKAFLSGEHLERRRELEAEQERLTTANTEIVNRIGTKIQHLREAMIAAGRGHEFACFRFAGRFPEYPLSYCSRPGWNPGGVYMQDVDKREEFVEEMLQEVLDGQ